MRSILKKISHPFLKLWLKLLYIKPRKYRYKDLEVIVHPDVFPPHMTISTKIFLDYITPIHLANKTVLELGCGSGIISLYASKKGAITTATDINQIALDYLKIAATKNSLQVEVINSDIFESLDDKKFEYILINPPYYPKEPKNIKEKAWFCGSNFEYFKKLFKQLPYHIYQHSLVYMILSEDCDIQQIQNIALHSNFVFECVLKKKVVAENNFIFSIKVKNNYYVKPYIFN